MTVIRLDHVTVLSADIDASETFYRCVLGLETGPRPTFPVRGIWLYCDRDPILHIVERVSPPREPGPLDHVGFAASGLIDYVERLDSLGVTYQLRRLPAPETTAGDWQLFFHDPNGARIEMRFTGAEPAPPALRRS